MLLVLVLCIAMGWFVRGVRTQREAVAAIEAAGGSIMYSSGANHVELETEPLPWIPKSLVARVGPDYFWPVVKADLWGKVSEAELAHVGRLRRLQSLTIMSTTVTDRSLARIEGLTRLRKLVLNLDARGVGDDFQVVEPGSGAAVGDATLARLAKVFAGLDYLNLNLGGTFVSDAGLVHLQGLSCLKYLDLSGSKVTGAGLVHLRGLANLRRLSLQNLHIGPGSLSQLKGLTDLDSLSLAHTDIHDADLAELKVLPRLASLYLFDTKITSAGLAHLQDAAPALYTLDLSETSIDDAGLQRLAAFPRLRRLGVTRTAVTKPAVAALQAACPKLVIVP